MFRDAATNPSSSSKMSTCPSTPYTSSPTSPPGGQSVWWLMCSCSVVIGAPFVNVGKAVNKVVLLNLSLIFGLKPALKQKLFHVPQRRGALKVIHPRHPFDNACHEHVIGKQHLIAHAVL